MSSLGRFTVAIVGSQTWDAQNDNVDVEIALHDGRRFAATFFTMRNIRDLFAKNRVTGECAGGLYLWAANMVIVEQLSLDTINETVADLIRSGELEKAFELLPDTKPPLISGEP